MKNQKAYCLILSKIDFFQRCQSEVDMRLEQKLKVGDPLELCEKYLAQNETKLSEEMSI